MEVGDVREYVSRRSHWKNFVVVSYREGRELEGTEG